MTELSPPSRLLHVFLCHSSADKPAVRELYNKLHSAGFKPWLDEEDLLPGQDFPYEISKAVRNSDAVIICLSRDSVSKEGFVQREIKYAVDVALEKPKGTIFLIPLKLEECEVPDEMGHLHWIKLFEGTGFSQLVKALQHRAEKLGLTGNLP